METLRNKRKLAAASTETPEKTRNSQSQKIRDSGMAQEYISQISEDIEGRVTKWFSIEFSRTESRFLGVLSKLDELLLNPQVRICSVAVPGTSRNNDSENWEPTGDRSLGDPCPEAMFSTYHSNNLNDSEHEETHHRQSGNCNFFYSGRNSLRYFRCCQFVFDSFSPKGSKRASCPLQPRGVWS